MRRPCSGNGSCGAGCPGCVALMRGQGFVVAVAGERRAAVGVRRRPGEMLRQHRRVERRIADLHRRERAAVAMDLLREQFAHVRHDRERQSQFDALLEPLLCGSMHQHRLDDAFQLFGVQIAFGGCGIARIGPELRQADHLAERHPLRRRDHRDAEPAVLGRKISDRKAAPEPVDADARPGEAGLQRQSRVELADLQHRFVR